MEKNNFFESAIYSGSDLNRRTFREDESWNSLMSTVLAGEFEMTGDSEKCNNNLTTVDEENFNEDEDSCFIAEDKEESLLNRNIDAISNDEEVYFDCQGIISPNIYSKNSRSPLRGNASYIKQGPVSTTRFLAADFHTINNNFDTTGDSGLDEERTGALLVQALDEFQNIKSLAESTPIKLSSRKIGEPLISSLQNMTNNNSGRKRAKDKSGLHSASKKKLNFSESKGGSRAKSILDDNNKENYFRGKCSVAAQMSRYHARVGSPAGRKRIRRVAAIKEFFESRGKISEQSAVTLLPNKTGASAKQMSSIKRQSPKSPSYHTHETYKLLKSSRNWTLHLSSSNSSITMHQNGSSGGGGGNNSSTRSSSCSDSFSADSLMTIGASLMNKSKSTGDLMTGLKSSMRIAGRRGANGEKRVSIMKQTPMARHCTTGCLSKSPKIVSDIMKRKSVGFVSSPVLPVREIRKMFSPSGGVRVNQDKKLINKHVSTGKKRLVCPKIIVNGK